MNAGPHHDELHDLAATRALYSAHDHDEHLHAAASRWVSREVEAMERAAAALHLAMAGPVSSMPPERVRSRLLSAADEFARTRRGFVAIPAAGRGGAAAAARPELARDAGPAVERPRLAQPPVVQTRGVGVPAWTAAAGWLAAAACLGLAAWVSRDVRPGPSSPEDGYRALLARGDVQRTTWTDWDNPEIKGVSGEVVWCESTQTGYLRLRGLPRNDPSREQYQLWIVDHRGLADASGQSARISGALFDGEPDGELVVPITPAIPVQGAALFAITVEKPGGTWVSDMTRRVAVASLASK